MSTGRIGSVFSLRTLDEHAAWLRQYLMTRGITPAEGSALDQGLGAIARLANVTRVPPSSPLDDEDFVSLIRDALGTDYLIEVLRRSERWLDRVGVEKLRVLRGPDVNLMRAARQSGERDVAWELFAGAVCDRFTQNVELEEPDIRCTFRGSTWGIAAKLLYSTKARQHIDRIVEGAKQIEDADVDVGVVLVNGSNLLPHAAFLRVLSPGVMATFQDPSEPAKMLRAAADKFFRGVGTGSFMRRLTQGEGRARNKTRRVLLFLQTVTSIKGAVATMSVCHSYDFRKIATADRDFWLGFHAAVQGTGIVPTFATT